MYDEQKTKSSMNLIPDRNWQLKRCQLKLHLKRSNLETYIWKQCTEKNMTMPALARNTWKEQKSKIIPVWFLTSQLPPCQYSKSKRVENGYNADNEEIDDRGKVDS